MSKVSIELPNSLHKKLREWASAHGTPIDQLIRSAVAEKLAALLTPDYLETRAKRGSRKKFEAALKTVPDVEPAEYDRLSNHTPRPTAAPRDKRRKPAKQVSAARRPA
jgi:hypothetical protein